MLNEPTLFVSVGQNEQHFESKIPLNTVIKASNALKWLLKHCQFSLIFCIIDYVWSEHEMGGWNMLQHCHLIGSQKWKTLVWSIRLINAVHVCLKGETSKILSYSRYTTISCLRGQQSKLLCPRCCGWPALREWWIWLLPMKEWNSCFITQLVFLFLSLT